MPRAKCRFLTGLLATVGLVMLMGVAPQPAAADCRSSNGRTLVQMTTEIGGRELVRVSLELEPSDVRRLLVAKPPESAGSPAYGNNCHSLVERLLDEACIMAAVVIGSDGRPQINLVADPDCKVEKGSGPPRGPKDDDSR